MDHTSTNLDLLVKCVAITGCTLYSFRASRAHFERPDSDRDSPTRLKSDSPWLLDEEAGGYGEDLVRRSAGSGDCRC